jgi:hypothetical protein
VTTDLLTPVAPGVFVHKHPGAATRTTVVRLPDGTLWMHAPPPWTPELGAVLASIGPVSHLVAVTPAQLEHTHQWREHHTGATCWAPAPTTAQAVLQKRTVPPCTPPESGRPAAWGGVLEVRVAKGNGLHAALVYHRPSGVLIVGRLLEARHRSQVPPLARALVQLTGREPARAHIPLAVHRHFLGQRRVLMETARWALQLRPTRVVPMRGALVDDNGAEVLADGFSIVGIDGPIPPWARFALGANPGGAVAFFVAAALTTGFLLGLDLPADTLLARFVTALVIADILGGIVAMSSRSTRRWWRQQSPALVAGFFGVHIAHPLALVAVHGGDGIWAAGLWLTALLGGSLVWLWPSRSTAGPLAMFAVALGAVLFSAGSSGPDWVASLYLLKLVGCFGYGVRQDSIQD